MLHQAVAALLACVVGVVSAKKCTNVTVPVTITARNAVFNIPAPKTNIDALNFVLNAAQQGNNYTDKILTGYKDVSGSYSLAATFCSPDSGPGKTVQLLTHGIAFDRSYWDFPFNDYNYSYVNMAVDDCGFSTFSWDRLGVGSSSQGDTVNEIQVSLEIAALRSLTSMLRSGKIPGVSHAFSKVVHVGHSFGSVQSYTLALQHPDESNGLVLTGFSQVGSYIPYFAYGGNFVIANKINRLKHYRNGYMISGDESAAQSNFFAPGQFDPDVLHEAFETAQPVTVGEMLTVAGSSGTASKFTGPVLVITGNRDIPFCGGDCSAGNILDKSKDMFPDPKKVQIANIPNAGHGLNFEYTHKDTFNTILNFVAKEVGK